jgi:ABC-type glycerol-3-phosphate transport system substrate-binding protein
LPLNHGGSFISAAASQQQANACWKWLKFLSTSANVGQGIPARLSVVESTAFRQRVGDEMIISYLALIENMSVSNAQANLDTNQAWLDVSYYWLIKAYEQVITDEADVEGALASAQQTFDAYRACIIEEDGFIDTEVQSQCAAEVGQ